MPTEKRKGLDRNFWQPLLAVLVGNVIYYAMYRYLPPLGQHHICSLDWGLAVDFWICVICYFLDSSEKSVGEFRLGQFAK